MRKNGRRSSAFVSSSSGEQGFWPSYADMMSAVALILFFLMLLSYIQNMITGNNLRGTEEELNKALAELAVTAQQVQEAQDELKIIFDDLEIARQDLDNQQIHIDEQQAHINEQELHITEQQEHIAQQAEYISQQQASIAEQRDIIAQQQAQAERQQAYLNSTQAELTQLRAQMQTVAVLRLSIVEQIRSSIEKVMGNANTVSVSENGSLVLSESVLFDRGSADLKGASKQVLDQLCVGFTEFLADPNNTQYVDTIVIGGHADSTGSAELNRELSSKRANSVLSYLLSTRNASLTPYAHFFSASGYGSTRPVADNATIDGQAKNRRIEISIILKDETVLQILDEYLAIEMPKG